MAHDFVTSFPGESDPWMMIQVTIRLQQPPTSPGRRHCDVDRADAPTRPCQPEQDLGVERSAKPIRLQIGELGLAEPAGDIRMAGEADDCLMAVTQGGQVGDASINLGEHTVRCIAE